MKLLFNLLIAICILNSCALIQKENKDIKQEDIFEFTSNDIDDITQQINLRKNKLLLLDSEINKLINYNVKVTQRADFEQVYNKDNSSINRYLEDNKKTIDKYKMIRSKIEKEIRVLERMYNKVNN